VSFFNFFLASKKKQKLAEVPKSYFALPKMGIFELSHIDDFHFSLQLRLTLFESSEKANSQRHFSFVFSLTINH
jgi:hypothetical protein